MTQAPPTIPAALSPEPEPPMPRAWPKAVGIISIVWGSIFGLSCNACGLLGEVIQKWAAGMAANAGQQPGSPSSAQPLPPLPDVMKTTVVDLAIYLSGVCMGLLLIIAGSVLLARKAIARPLHLVYGSIALLLTLGGGIHTLMKQQAFAEWAKQNPDNQWAKFGAGGPLSMIVAAVMTLFFLSYPLFVLIWFGAIKRDTREITEGFDQEPAF